MGERGVVVRRAGLGALLGCLVGVGTQVLGLPAAGRGVDGPVTASPAAVSEQRAGDRLGNDGGSAAPDPGNGFRARPDRGAADAVPMPQVQPSQPGPVPMPRFRPSEPGPVPMPEVSPFGGLRDVPLSELVASPSSGRE